MKTRKIQTIEANMHTKNSHTTMEALCYSIECSVMFYIQQKHIVV